jgi:Protein of unknown function (DUF1566)
MEDKTMPDTEQQTKGLGTVFLEAIFKKYDDISSTIKTNTFPQFKRFVRNVALAVFLIFIGSFLLVAIGTTSEIKILTVLGRLGLIFAAVVLFFVATPVGYVFAGRKYVTFIRSFAIYQLFITLVIWISPMPVSASLLFGLSFAGCLLAYANIFESNPGIVRIFTTVIFLGLLAATYFPSFRDKFDSKIVAMNEPSLIQIYTGDLKAGKIKFFLKGQPKVWYLRTPGGSYELFDHSGYHDIYQKELQPITPEIASKLINDENLLSSRNLQKREVQEKAVVEQRAAAEQQQSQSEQEALSQHAAEEIAVAEQKPAESEHEAQIQTAASERARLEAERQKQAVFTPPVTFPQRDGYFIAYDNGTVLDTRTNLMWAARDSGGAGIDWRGAKEYCENYRGGGYTDWRMPTLNEVAGLYNQNESYEGINNQFGRPQAIRVHLTKLIQLSDCCVWTSDADNYFASVVQFHNGEPWRGIKSFSPNARALPVRLNN